MPNSFNKEVYALHYGVTLFKTRIEAKKMNRVLEFNQSQWLKSYVKFKVQKNNRSRKNRGKNEKVLYRLTRDAVYGKTMKNLRNKTDVRLLSNRRDYLK